jgi:hypothetical protein
MMMAQKNVSVNINHELAGSPFALNQATQNNIGHLFKVTRLQYYITRFTILHDGGLETIVDDSVVVLVDASMPTNIYLGLFNITNIEGLKFHVGVHSPTNHEDISAIPQSDPLGPKSPSMHWGWTPGYRFVAFEAQGGAQYNNTIELHGLGDENYYETAVVTNGIINGSDILVNVFADYTRGVEGMLIEDGVIYHGADKNASVIVINFNNYVFSGQSSLEIEEIQKSVLVIYPSPSSGQIMVQWEKLNSVESLCVYNMNGQLIQNHTVSEQKELPIFINETGTYIIEIKQKSGSTSQSKVVIR